MLKTALILLAFLTAGGRRKPGLTSDEKCIVRDTRKHTAKVNAKAIRAFECTRCGGDGKIAKKVPLDRRGRRYAIDMKQCRRCHGRGIYASKSAVRAVGDYYEALVAVDPELRHRCHSTPPLGRWLAAKLDDPQTHRDDFAKRRVDAWLDARINRSAKSGGRPLDANPPDGREPIDPDLVKLVAASASERLLYWRLPAARRLRLAAHARRTRHPESPAPDRAAMTPISLAPPTASAAPIPAEACSTAALGRSPQPDRNDTAPDQAEGGGSHRRSPVSGRRSPRDRSASARTRPGRYTGTRLQWPLAPPSNRP